MNFVKKFENFKYEIIKEEKNIIKENEEFDEESSNN